MRAGQPAIEPLAPVPPPSPSRTAGRAEGVAPFLGFVALAAILAAAVVVPTDADYAPALIVPAAIAGGIAVAARPDFAVVGLLILTGFQGTILLYTPLPGRAFVDFILAALWVGSVWATLNYKNRPVWLLPGVVALGVYAVISGLGAVFSENPGDGISSLHLSVWLMAATFLIGLAPWTSATYWNIAKGALVVAILVGLYALYRTITGPADAERELALRGKPGFLALKTSGSLPSAGHLASWCTAFVPFALALSLSMTGRWRWVAVGAFGLSLFAVLATEVRTGIVAAGAGALLVLVLIGTTRAFPGPVKATRVAITVAGALLLGTGAYITTIGTSDESSARFERILNPEDDFAFSTRLVRWEEAFEVMSENPFGQGLGTLGAVAADKPIDPDLTRQLDSSYIKVGVEQGPWVLAFFVIALLLLLINLCWRSITTLDPARAALGIAGAGVLLGVSVSFYANTYIEEPQILAGWLLVGLGVAQFSRPPESPEPTSGDESENPARA